MLEVSNDDRQCFVYVGNLIEGFDFFGPFDNSELAQQYIDDEVNPVFESDWAYLEPPRYHTVEELNMEVPSNSKPLKVKNNIIPLPLPSLPAASVILNNDGKVIGEQLEIPE